MARSNDAIYESTPLTPPTDEDEEDRPNMAGEGSRMMEAKADSAPGKSHQQQLNKQRFPPGVRHVHRSESSNAPGPSEPKQLAPFDFWPAPANPLEGPKVFNIKDFLLRQSLNTLKVFDSAMTMDQAIMTAHHGDFFNNFDELYDDDDLN